MSAPAPASAITLAAFASALSASTAGKGSSRFRALRDSQAAALLTDVLDRLIVGDEVGTRELLMRLREQGVHYRVAWISDTPPGQVVLGLLEDSLPGSSNYKGWGGLLVRPQPHCNRVYQAPHVKADAYTSDLALAAFLHDPRSGIALFAGAHRRANRVKDENADVTRATDNLFHVLTEHLARQGVVRNTPFWFIQFHGSRERLGEPAITGSTGTRTPDPEQVAVLRRLSEVVNAAGYLRMGICGVELSADDEDDGDYHLCGTENEQGRLLERLGMRDHFLHLEVDHGTRVAFHRGHGDAYYGVVGLLQALRDQLP